jgi:hypothetical protein
MKTLKFILMSIPFVFVGLMAGMWLSTELIPPSERATPVLPIGTTTTESISLSNEVLLPPPDAEFSDILIDVSQMTKDEITIRIKK